MFDDTNIAINPLAVLKPEKHRNFFVVLKNQKNSLNIMMAL